MKITPAITETLDRDDPAVQAAREAEIAAYDYYGIDHTEHYIELNDLGTRIRVVESGEGPPLVLIMGGRGKGMEWLPLMPELDEYTLYVMDRPGGGLSDGIDYRSVPLDYLAAHSTISVFDHFELASAPVVGNSMGGLWTLRFAQAHPERVSSIALLGCPTAYPGTSAPLPMRIGSISVLSGLFVEQIMQPDDPDDARDGLAFFGHPEQTRERLPNELVEAAYLMDTLPTYKPTWVGILQTVLRLRGATPDAAITTDDLRTIDQPVLLIWGRDDPFGSVETGRAGAQFFPDAEFHDVGMGHLPWFDDPETCGELLQEFLDPQE